MIFLGVAGGGPGEDGPTSVASYSAGGDDDWIEMDSSVHSSYDSANSSSTAVVTTEDENQSPTNKLPVVDSVVSTTDVISAGSEMAAVAVTAHSLDALLAQELNALTFQERQGIDEEIHGVHSSSVDETPDFVKEKLSALEREVQKIRNKDAYDRAVQLNSSYIRDADNFLLPFLRAEFFREEEAAKRMVKFLTFMVDLYGEVALTRPMYLSDMNAEDMKFMKVGAFQVLPGRDRSGRRIYGLFDDIPPETPIKSRVGSFYFAFSLECCGIQYCSRWKFSLQLLILLYHDFCYSRCHTDTSIIVNFHGGWGGRGNTEKGCGRYHISNESQGTSPH